MSSIKTLLYEIKEQFIIHNLDYNEYRNAIHENALEEFDESDDEEQTERGTFEADSVRMSDCQNNPQSLTPIKRTITYIVL